MKRISKVLIIAVWAIIFVTLFKLNLLTGNMDEISKVFSSCGDYKAIIFIVLSSLRIAAFIPSAVFMILGGVIFSPMEGVLLSLVSVMLSESIVYITARILVGSDMQNYVINIYPKLYELLLKNNTNILAIGILCPIAPSDAACFLVGSTGICYRKFILAVVISNMPMVILYSFLGNSFLSSSNNTIMISCIILIISIYSLYLWNKEQSKKTSLKYDISKDCLL